MAAIIGTLTSSFAASGETYLFQCSEGKPGQLEGLVLRLVTRDRLVVTATVRTTSPRIHENLGEVRLLEDKDVRKREPRRRIFRSIEGDAFQVDVDLNHYSPDHLGFQTWVNGGIKGRAISPTGDSARAMAVYCGRADSP